MADGIERMLVRWLDPQSGTEGQAVVIGPDGEFIVGDVTTTGGGTGTGSSIYTHVDRRMGTNLTKQGVVIAKGAAGEWDADIVEGPSFLLDPLSGQMLCCYTGYGSTIGGVQRGSLGLATSTDGITWTKPAAPFFTATLTSGDPDEGSITGGVLLWDAANTQYVLYYIGCTSAGYEGGVKSLCWATADAIDGTWTRHGVAIAPAGTGWRSGNIWHPNIVERDGTWYCFFNANGAEESIGFATAPAIIGPWTVDDVNSPVLTRASGWDSGWVADPCVRRVGDLWAMHYYGYHTDIAQDGIAVTPDSLFPLGWVRYPGNPVLTPGPDAFDAKYAHKPVIFERGGVLFHYYTCVATDGTRQIALATEGLPAATSGVPTSREVGTDSTLTGGGDLSADLILGVDTSAEAERIRDVIAAALVEGSNVTITVDDAGNTITISATGGGGAGLVPLTTVIGGVPELVWDADNQLVMTEAP